MGKFKKIIMTGFCFIVFFSGLTSTVQAVESNAIVSIVGEDSVDNKKNNGANDLSNNASNGGPNEKQLFSLPKTGEVLSGKNIIIGILVFLILFIVLRVKNKKKKFVLLFLISFGSITSSTTYAEEIPKHVSTNNIFNIPTGGSLSVNSAKIDSRDNGLVVITDNLGQTGSIWSTANNVMDLTKDFELETYVRQYSDKDPADGMSFVMQGNVPNEPLVWYTNTGGLLGLYASTDINSTPKGIPNSLNIEFDLYLNTTSVNRFDNGITGQHIADSYPSQIQTYEKFTDGGTTYRTQKHYNLQDNLKLSDGTWTKLEVSYKADGNHLKYRTTNASKNTDSGWKIMNNLSVRQQLGIDKGATKAYWGFVGTTGPTLYATQQAIFTKIPGLVNASSDIKVINNGTEITSGSEVKTNSKLSVSVSSQYHSGKQDWTNVLGSVTLPEGLKLIPNTTRVDGVSISDTNWSGNKLSNINFSNLSLKKNKANITFDVLVSSFVNKTDDTGAKIPELINAKFSGDNFIDDVSPFEFTVDSFNFTILEPLNNATFKPNIRDFPIIVEVEDYTNVALKNTISNSLGDILHTGDIAAYQGKRPHTIDPVKSMELFEKLPAGKQTLTYTIKNGNKDEISQNMTFTKLAKPILKIEDSVKNIYPFGTDKIPFNFEVSGQTSSKYNLYVSVDETASEQVKLDIINKNFDYPLDVTKLAPGAHTFSWYVIDEHGVESDPVSKTIILDGLLTFKQFPTDFIESELELNTIKKVKGLDLTVSDTRYKKDPWSLSVRLNHNFYNKEKDDYAHNDFFLYKNADKKEIISSTSSAKVIKDYKGGNDTTDIRVNQAGSSGFYFSSNFDMYIGDYTAGLVWQLESTPTE